MTGLAGLFVTRDGSNNGTTPKGARQALGGLLAGNGGSPLDVRKGVLVDAGGAVVAGKANMSYDVRAFRAVLVPSTAQGPIVAANDAVVNIATTAAPGSNSRIDVIWCRQHQVAADGGADSDVVLEIGVTQGSVAASPSVPAIPSGALSLAQVTVTSGITVTSGLTFTRTHAWTAANGGVLPVYSSTERSAITPYEGMAIWYVPSKALQVWDSAAPGWRTISPDAADTGWVPLTAIAPFNVVGDTGVRKIGTMVVMRGAIQRASGFSSISTPAATVPAGFRPPTNTHYFAPGCPSPLVGVRGFIETDGTVNIGMEAASTNAMGIATTWFTD